METVFLLKFSSVSNIKRKLNRISEILYFVIDYKTCYNNIRVGILFFFFQDEEDLCSTQLNMLGGLSNNLSSSGSSTAGTECHWQQKLECAQNVLFCKELFSQLAREAVALKMDIPPLVVANQITATIFPGIHLLIALCHSHPDRCSHLKMACNISSCEGSNF